MIDSSTWQEACQQRTVDDLALTQDHLLDAGWCQHTLMDEQGRLCLVGAIRHAVDPHLTAYRPEREREICAQTAVFQYLQGRSQIHRSDGLARWNDEPGRTLQQVLDVLHGTQQMIKERL